MKSKKTFWGLCIILSVFTVPLVVMQFRNTGLLAEKKKVISTVNEHELDIVYGNDSAKLTIFLFSSYNCVFCQKFFKSVLPDLKKEYLDQGTVKLVIKPVSMINNESVINSLKIAVCINKYGNFDKLHELLLAEPKVVYTQEFVRVIDDLVQKDPFVAECMYGGESGSYITNNMIEFKNLEFTGTPTFVINNSIYKGYMDYNRFKKVIEKELLDAWH